MRRLRKGSQQGRRRTRNDFTTSLYLIRILAQGIPIVPTIPADSTGFKRPRQAQKCARRHKSSMVRNQATPDKIAEEFRAATIPEPTLAESMLNGVDLSNPAHGGRRFPGLPPRLRHRRQDSAATSGSDRGKAQKLRLKSNCRTCPKTATEESTTKPGSIPL